MLKNVAGERRKGYVAAVEQQIERARPVEQLPQSPTPTLLFRLSVDDRTCLVDHHVPIHGNQLSGRHKSKTPTALQHVASVEQPTLSKCVPRGMSKAVYHQIISTAEAYLGQVGSAATAQGLASHLSLNLPITDAQVHVHGNMASTGFAARKRLNWSTDHSFVVIHTGNWTLVVEPNFRSYFEVPRASEGYESFLRILPQLLVIEADVLHTLLDILARRMALEFKRMGLPLPPWRYSRALKARWQGLPQARGRTAPCPHAGVPYVVNAAAAPSALPARAAPGSCAVQGQGQGWPVVLGFEPRATSSSSPLGCKAFRSSSGSGSDLHNTYGADLPVLYDCLCGAQLDTHGKQRVQKGGLKQVFGHQSDCGQWPCGGAAHSVAAVGREGSLTVHKVQLQGWPLPMAMPMPMPMQSVV